MAKSKKGLEAAKEEEVKVKKLSKAKFQSLVDKYLLVNNAKKKVSTLQGSLSSQVKEQLEVQKLTSFKGKGAEAILTTRNGTSVDMVALMEEIKKKKLDLKAPIIKTVEMIDMEELESAMAHGIVPAKLLAKHTKITATVALTVKEIKKKT